jgi:hypothetical protein
VQESQKKNNNTRIGFVHGQRRNTPSNQNIMDFMAQHFPDYNNAIAASYVSQRYNTIITVDLRILK